MTSQTLTTDQSASASSRHQAQSEVAGVEQVRAANAAKAQYQLDQQVKLLHLQAETESLLQQLQAIKQQRQVAAEVMQH